jgi:hypothetical protein
MPTLSERDARSPRRLTTGAGWLVVGFGLVGVSLLILLENVQVSGGGLSMFGWGLRGFGWSLLPLLLGVAWIVVQPRGIGGWALAVIGLGIVVVEILGSMTFYFRPISLLTLLAVLVPGAIGLALVAKHL